MRASAPAQHLEVATSRTATRSPTPGRTPDTSKCVLRHVGLVPPRLLRHTLHQGRRRRYCDVSRRPSRGATTSDAESDPANVPTLLRFTGTRNGHFRLTQGGHANRTPSTQGWDEIVRIRVRAAPRT